jgi:hypothetical protein
MARWAEEPTPTHTQALGKCPNSRPGTKCPGKASSRKNRPVGYGMIGQAWSGALRRFASVVREKQRMLSRWERLEDPDNDYDNRDK